MQIILTEEEYNKIKNDQAAFEARVAEALKQEKRRIKEIIFDYCKSVNRHGEGPLQYQVNRDFVGGLIVAVEKFSPTI